MPIERRETPHERTRRQKAERRGTVRRWVCATCRQPTTLITCSDGKQRCPEDKAAFDREQKTLRCQGALHAPSAVQPAGQPLTPGGTVLR